MELRAALLLLLAATFCWRCGAAGEDTAPHTVLWDTRRVADGGEVDLGGKKGWELVSPGTAAHALEGDVVVENERIAVVFCRRSAGPLVCPKPVPQQGTDRVRLVPIAPGGQQTTSLGQIVVRKNSEDEVALEVSTRTQSGQEIRTTYSLARGRVFIECRPVQNAGRIRVEAATRFAVLPDFFGADMVFDPRSYSRPRLIVPSENFVLNLLEGENTIAMSVWPTGSQEAELVLAGAKEERRIGATEIAFDGKSVYVALLHSPGIWHEHRLREPYADRDVALGWKRPFPAKWRANFCAQRRSDSWDFHDRRGDTWMYLYQEMVWPCWFDGDNGLVRLSRRFIDVKGAMDSVLVYPSDRKKETPLATFTPVDIVRDTLGVGPCEYVLDREGLQGRSANTGRKNFGRGVCDTTTPIEYLFILGIEARESVLIGHLVDDILADNRAINARVLEFRGFGRQLGELCATMRRDSAPATHQLLDEAGKNAKEIEALYQEKLPTIKNPAHAAQLGQRVREIASRSDPENLGECKTLTRELREIAGTQHRMIGDYRVMVKRLRQQAAIIGAEEPAAVKAAERIRKLAGQVLRKKYGVEGD
ncbi:MAG TPA: hypothetical protein VNE39_17695 [Planctomycetota bacterium]|nr:hypothetical protein [Planctomycetota bacterium]